MPFRLPPYGPDREQVEAAKRTIEQTRSEMAELESQIRSSKETIAKSEKVLARLKALFPDLEDTKPEDSA
jgi:septal ring factor EnvC (AmiA/AmiB activator)